MSAGRAGGCAVSRPLDGREPELVAADAQDFDFVDAVGSAHIPAMMVVSLGATCVPVDATAVERSVTLSVRS